MFLKFRRNKAQEQDKENSENKKDLPEKEPAQKDSVTEIAKAQQPGPKVPETKAQQPGPKVPETKAQQPGPKMPEAKAQQPGPEPEMPKTFERADPDPETGLTGEQVKERVRLGAVNASVQKDEVTFGKIVRENVFTYFNLIFLIIAICLLAVRSYKDLSFVVVIAANTLIGIFQEWQSKKTLDQLNIVTVPKSTVIRDGHRYILKSEDLVPDDIIVLTAGSQIPADAVVKEGEVSVNESLLTGEEDEITKKTGDPLLSGSFIVSGSCRARIDKVGSDSYSAGLTQQARVRKKGEQSEMIRSLDRLVKAVGIIIIPIAILLFYQQYAVNHMTVRSSVISTAAAILGMIPEGLYLLASVAMAVSAARLAYNRVLVHNMKSIETLARVDVLCVDKTGTITENDMQVSRIIPLKKHGETGTDSEPAESSGQRTEPVLSGDELARLIGDFVSVQNNDNVTMRALKSYFTKNSDRPADRVIPFSPVYKYSGIVVGENTYVCGAPEFVLRSDYDLYRQEISDFAGKGYRVLVFGRIGQATEGGELTQPVLPLGLILLSNPVRKNAAETFRYFEKQKVAIKVISGDNPATVSRAAREASVKDADKFIDASTLRDDELEDACEKYTVFGRVTPQQKRALIAALKKKGHTVAMTGDGVNDVLALRDADCSIAMASGSEAAERAAQMVLMESDFSRMPSVVMEGRRVVNNIERTASLFLVKNIFSLLMSIFTIIFNLNYPLEPSQISLISAFTIGIPAFMLSLESNRDIIRGHFMSNVMFRALPAGLTDFLTISGLVVFCNEFNVGKSDMSTSCTILMAVVGFMILYRIMSPMTKFHRILYVCLLLALLFCMTFMNNIFAITALSGRSAMLLVLFALAAEPILRYLSLLIGKLRQWFSNLHRDRDDFQTI